MKTEIDYIRQGNVLIAKSPGERPKVFDSINKAKRASRELQAQGKVVRKIK